MVSMLNIVWNIIMIIFVYCYFEQGTSIDNRGNMINLISKNIQSYNWFDMTNSSSDFINKLQFEYRCCGGQQGYRDWEVLKPDNVPYGAFPVSCCLPRLGPEFQLEWCPYELVEIMVSASQSMIIIISLF
mgnify:CR=1 FL=1